jgi:cell division protein FtsQ
LHVFRAADPRMLASGAASCRDSPGGGSDRAGTINVPEPNRPSRANSRDEPVAMDYRGFLDRLKRQPKQAVGLHSPAWHGTVPRWQRATRRWGSALLTMKVPHGVGASAASMLILSSVVYGAVRGGHGPEIAENVQDLCDDAANAMGFRISEIALTGEHELDRQRVLGIAGITGRSSLLFLDAEKTRERLMGNPWIAQATVLKLYPGRLRIEVKERKPYALWQKNGQVYLIAEDGTVLDNFVPQRFASLPLVVGKGAEHAAPSLLAMVRHFPGIANELKASVLVAERRWDLYLKDNLVVSLPEIAPEHALSLLTELDRSKKLLSRDIVAIDLRLPDRVAVRQSDAAAAAREAALKAAEKAAKKKKAGEA